MEESGELDTGVGQWVPGRSNRCLGMGETYERFNCTQYRIFLINNKTWSPMQNSGSWGPW